MDNKGFTKTSFWNFKAPKAYTSTREVILDFLTGWFIPTIIVRFLWLQTFSKIIVPRFEQLGEKGSYEYSPFPIEEALPLLIPFFLIILLLTFSVFYFWKRRKHLAYGLLVSLVFSIPSFIIMLSLL